MDRYLKMLVFIVTIILSIAFNSSALQANNSKKKIKLRQRNTQLNMQLNWPMKNAKKILVVLHLNLNHTKLNLLTPNGIGGKSVQ